MTGMNKSHCCLFTCALAFLSAISLAAATEGMDQPLRAVFQGRALIVQVVISPTGSDIVLNEGKKRRVLSAGFGGESIFPSVQLSDGNAFVIWPNYGPQGAAVGIYEFASQQSVRCELSGFHFVSSPQLALDGNRALGFFFLGNRNDPGQGDNAFFYDLGEATVSPISHEERSVKRFRVRPMANHYRVETETLWERTSYRVSLSPFTATRNDRLPLSRRRVPRPTKADLTTATDCLPFNTYLGFGDSITWGKMRMYDLDGEYHPELAYLQVMKPLLDDSYGSTTSINEGVPGDDTLDGAQRIDDTLADADTRYFLLLLGTNDCWRNIFSLASSRENLEYIADAALAKGMLVIESTVPPRKDYYGQFQYVWNNINALNTAIKEIAEEKKFSVVDTYTSFMNYYPPAGWKSLLEDIGGNHPSPKGHQIMASLFAPTLVAFPPILPAAADVAQPVGNHVTVTWPANCEADFSHYRLEYGFTPQRVFRSFVTADPTATFSLLPFMKTVYFRIQAVDKSDHASASSSLYSTGN